MLEEAIKLARSGFYVFPLVPNAKTPLFPSYTEKATRDKSQIRKWWVDPVMEVEQPYNIGIATSKYLDGKALVVVDVDNRKDGPANKKKLEDEGYEFPKTITQKTPGGRHLLYISDKPLKQGTDVLARGLDIRSNGGYIVASGSIIDGEKYTMDIQIIAEVPDWIETKCGEAKDKPKNNKEDVLPKDFDVESAVEKATQYLQTAPVAIEGDAGDQTTFKVVCELKDLGVPEKEAVTLLFLEWNDRCQPPWDVKDLETKVHNAYHYSRDTIGNAVPELLFKKEVPPIDSEHRSPLEKVNDTFAFVTAGGGHHILWDTTDSKGDYFLDHLNEHSFHKKFANKKLVCADGKIKPITTLWMEWDGRKTYKGICFMPGVEAPNEWFNLWRGFAFEPPKENETLPDQAHQALESFLEHALENVCQQDEILCDWLLDYFAQLIQKPNVKPLTSLVFRGGKGVGKNSLIDCVGRLLGSHYLLTSNRRYLTGNFNGHLENRLLFVLDEAFWSGDKQAEGILKDLITGKTHLVEHKGKEPYVVSNCTRIVILGNEDWLVPASHDERRFCVLDVGDKRKQDTKFFEGMENGMKAGGYRLLLEFLLKRDLSKSKINIAPDTAALLDQKISSLDPFNQWLMDCLTEGHIVGCDLDESWPDHIEKDRLREAFSTYTRKRQIRSRILDARSFGKALKKRFERVHPGQKTVDERIVKTYVFPSLEVCRLSWEKYMRHKIIW